MKKYIIFFAILIINNSFARDFGFNFWGGIVRSKVNAENSILSYGPYSEARRANCIGGQIDVELLERISAGIGASYINSGGHTKKQAGTNLNGGAMGDFYVAQKLKYLEVPIHIKYKWTKKIFNPFLTTGFTYGKLLDAKEVIEFENNSKFGMEKKIVDHFNKNNISFDVGIGADIPFTKTFGFFIMLNNSFGLTNQFDTNDSKVTQKQNKLVYIIGTTFNI